MKKAIILAVLVLTLLLLGCSWAPPDSEPMTPGQDVQQAPADLPTASEANIEIKDFSFSPATVTIKAGGTVTWTQRDSVKHDITADDGSFTSPLLSEGESWSRTFDNPGTYAFHCNPHQRMKGTIIVE